MSTTKSVSTFDPSVPKNPVMVTTSFVSTCATALASIRSGGRTTEAGNEGDNGVGLRFDSMDGVLRLLLNQLDFPCTAGGGATTTDCWKKDFGGGEGGGGFRKPSIRANILGDGGAGDLVPLLIGDGEGWNLGGVLSRGFTLTRDHRTESSGMKQMQKRNK